MIKVYIASPYTKGDVAVNVKRQIDFADLLISMNCAPFAPLYSHFQHMVHPRLYTDWMKLDLEWIESCDCLFRLSGESEGADIEVEYAKEIGIPVFTDLRDLIKFNLMNTFKKVPTQATINSSIKKREERIARIEKKKAEILAKLTKKENQ